jgi:hypothetical protein
MHSHSLHIIKDSHKYRRPIASGLGKKAIVTNREFLQARSLLGLVTVGEGATDFLGLGELNQDKWLC